MERIRLLVADGAERRFTHRVCESPQTNGFDFVVPDHNTEAALLKCANEADAVLTYQTAISAAVIAAAPSLKFIQKHGINCRNIDVAAATRRRIAVATLPLMRNATVAEHAFALMLACARQLIPAHQSVTQASYQQMGLVPAPTTERSYSANWSRIEGISELFGARVGIVGMGDIGMELAKRCRAFDMSVCYFQRTRQGAEIEEAQGLRYLPLNELLAASDFVVLLLPHTAETEGLVDESALARMKSSATLINVGRGGVVDEDALIAALQSKRIAMAGLDVFRTEPLPATSALLALPNVVLLPHLGGGSYRSWAYDIPAALKNIRKFFSGEVVDHIVRA